MNFYDCLLAKYGFENPIIENEIQMDNYKKNAIRQFLYLLEKDQKIIRYSSGIYYIPRDSLFGKSKITFEKVIERKYIENDKEIYGFYTGIYFKNLMGLSSQMVNVPEIVSNKEPSKKRKIELNGRNAIVRKSITEITKENVKILQFFDLFKYLAFEEVLSYKDKLIEYIRVNQLTRAMVEDYLTLYSKQVVSSLIRSGLIYEFA